MSDPVTANPPPPEMDLARFRLWNPGDGRRYELIDGVPRAMAEPSDEHAILAARLAQAIDLHLRRVRPHCRVLSPGNVPRPADRRWQRDSYRVPDLVVKCGRRADPVLVIEILSPGDTAVEMDEKHRYYNTIPTIDEYLVVRTTGPEASLFRRRGELLNEVTLFDGDGPVTLASLGGCTLDLASLVRDLPPTDPADPAAA